MIEEYDFTNFWDDIKKFHEIQQQDRERDLAWNIQKYDFIVGSAEAKDQLERILPEGANIVYSKYIDSPTKIFAIKKFDAFDFMKFKEC